MLFIVLCSVKHPIQNKLCACSEHVHTFSEFGMRRKVLGYKLRGWLSLSHLLVLESKMTIEHWLMKFTKYFWFVLSTLEVGCIQVTCFGQWNMSQSEKWHLWAEAVNTFMQFIIFFYLHIIIAIGNIKKEVFIKKKKKRKRCSLAWVLGSG